MAATPEAVQRSSPVAVLVMLIWLGVVIAGTSLMVVYATAPGNAGLPPAVWPAASQLPRDTSQPTLVMFVHPRCPCSRAGIGELALLMAHCEGRVGAHVFFLKPQEMAEDWTRSDTWRAAAEIPGVTVHYDSAGHEARQFGVETSGDTLLYDKQGRLLFHGGITISRGHSGDNPGRKALQTLLLGESSQKTITPVFGCALFDSESQNCQASQRAAN